MKRYGHAAFLAVKPTWLHEAWDEISADLAAADTDQGCAA